MSAVDGAQIGRAVLSHEPMTPFFRGANAREGSVLPYWDPPGVLAGRHWT